MYHFNFTVLQHMTGGRSLLRPSARCALSATRRLPQALPPPRPPNEKFEKVLRETIQMYPKIKLPWICLRKIKASAHEIRWRLHRGWRHGRDWRWRDRCTLVRRCMSRVQYGRLVAGRVVGVIWTRVRRSMRMRLWLRLTGRQRRRGAR